MCVGGSGGGPAETGARGIPLGPGGGGEVSKAGTDGLEVETVGTVGTGGDRGGGAGGDNDEVGPTGRDGAVAGLFARGGTGGAKAGAAGAGTGAAGTAGRGGEAGAAPFSWQSKPAHLNTNCHGTVPSGFLSNNGSKFAHWGALKGEYLDRIARTSSSATESVPRCLKRVSSGVPCPLVILSTDLIKSFPHCT